MDFKIGDIVLVADDDDIRFKATAKIVDIDLNSTLAQYGVRFADQSRRWYAEEDLICAPATNIDATLAERGTRYGAFTGHARITQNLKRALVDSPNWATLSDDKKECLEMVVHKIGRILNGDAEFHDSWHDIIGYVKLVENTLEALDGK